MSNKLRVHKVTEWPDKEDTQENAVYFKGTAAGNLLTIGVSNNNAQSIRSTMTPDDITALIANNVNIDHLVRVADVVARDALVLTKNQYVIVTDASADPNVTSGEGIYEYNVNTDVYTLYDPGNQPGWTMSVEEW